MSVKLFFALCAVVAVAQAMSVPDYKDLMLAAHPADPQQTQGTCGGSCTSSASCATSAGDTLCRCVNFVCSITEPCGGGCVATAQCEAWDTVEANCVCTWSFKCELQSKMNARLAADK